MNSWADQLPSVSDPTSLDEMRLETLVGEILSRSPYREVREVGCSARGTKVVLIGRVSSYYYKQLAQSQLRPQLAVTISVVNELEVVE